jgi:hypothetical protein
MAHLSMRKYFGTAWVGYGCLLVIWLIISFAHAPPGSRLTDAWVVWVLAVALMVVGCLHVLNVRWSALALRAAVGIIALIAVGALLFEIRIERPLGIMFCSGSFILSITTEALLLLKKSSRGQNKVFPQCSENQQYKPDGRDQKRQSSAETDSADRRGVFQQRF